MELIIAGERSCFNLDLEDPMIALHIDGTKFQLRAAAVFMQDGYVLLHRAERDAFWALPGGRVEVGEASTSAVVREMQEELRETVECGDLLFVAENFFGGAGEPHHEVGLYFRTRLASNSPIIDTSRTHFGVEGNNRLIFRWFALDALAELDIRPAFLKEALKDSDARLRHAVHRE